MVWGGGLSGAISAYPVKGTRRTICDTPGDKDADGNNQRRLTFVPIVNTPVGATRPSQRASVASVRKSIAQSLASLAILSAPDATEPRTSMFQGFSAAAASLFTPRDKDADKIRHRRSLGDIENGDKNRSETLYLYPASCPVFPLGSFSSGCHSSGSQLALRFLADRVFSDRRLRASATRSLRTELRHPLSQRTSQTSKRLLSWVGRLAGNL